jgi:hypothetical protein
MHSISSNGITRSDILPQEIGNTFSGAAKDRGDGGHNKSLYGSVWVNLASFTALCKR